jgi:hypothetical protein
MKENQINENGATNVRFHSPLFQLLIVFCVLAFLYATKHHLPFKESIDWVQATDVHEYLVIASSAPAFPGERISVHFSQRWIPHYLVGYLSHFFKVELATVYGLANFAVLASILFATLRVLLTQAKNEMFGLLLFLVLALSAFSFRLNVFVPGLLADLVFVLGLTIALNGLASKSIASVLCGAIVATAGKQLSILALPGLCLYVFVVFSTIHGKVRATIFGGLVCIVTMGFYAFLVHSSAGFAVSNTMTISTLLSVIPWLFSDRFSAILFLEHLVRIFLPLAPFLLIWKFFPEPKEAFGEPKRNPLKTIEGWALGLLILGPLAYAFLPGPLVQMGNQSRYMVATMLPMALLVIQALPNATLELRRIDGAIVTLILCLISYHHMHSMIQSSQLVFGTVHLLGLVGLSAWMLLRKSALTGTKAI